LDNGALSDRQEEKMRALSAWLLPVVLLLAGSDEFDAGVRAYREGRFAEAVLAFDAAGSSAGENASPEVLFNQALAALGARDLDRVQAAAERAAAQGGAEFAALRDFLQGNVAFVRCERAEEEAKLPGAPPFALDLAITQAGAAREAWMRAATSRADWPEARRNVERALLKLAELERMKQEAEKKKEEEREPEPPDSEEDATLDPMTEELSPEMLKRLLEKIDEKEREKAEVRRAYQRVQRADVERDW
jgi:hypothetical protein